MEHRYEWRDLADSELRSKLERLTPWDDLSINLAIRMREEPAVTGILERIFNP
jgi:hypothetical protein